MFAIDGLDVSKDVIVKGGYIFCVSLILGSQMRFKDGGYDESVKIGDRFVFLGGSSCGCFHLNGRGYGDGFSVARDVGEEILDEGCESGHGLISEMSDQVGDVIVNGCVEGIRFIRAFVLIEGSGEDDIDVCFKFSWVFESVKERERVGLIGFDEKERVGGSSCGDIENWRTYCFGSVFEIVFEEAVVESE